MVQNNSIQTSNIFSSFPTYNLEEKNVVLEPQASINVSESTKDSLEISTQKSKKKKILFGSTLASTILTAGILGMVLSKGVHGSSLNKLSRVKDKLAREISQANNHSQKDITQKTVFYAKKGVRGLIDKLEASANFAALKDYWSNHFLNKNKTTAKFANGTRRVFKNVSDKTLGKQYDKVGKKVDDFYSLLKKYHIDKMSTIDDIPLTTKIDIKGETKTLGEWLSKLEEHVDKLDVTYKNSFSKGARVNRNVKRSRLLKKVPDEIAKEWKGKNPLEILFASKTYVTKDVSASAQKTLKDEILKSRKEVSYNIQNITDDISSQISAFSKSIKVDDNKSVEFVKHLNQQLDAFTKCKGANESACRKEIVEKMSKSIDDMIAQINKNSVNSVEEKDSIIKILTSIKSTAQSTSENSKGSIEEIITIVNGLNKHNSKIISKAEKDELLKLSSKISKDLGKATELEMGEYFLKQAELEVGSAATDVISLLFPIGAGAFAIAKGDDKDEKISAVLNTCIPLVGSFATFIYGTTKMFSGAKNLIFSGVSGILLGKLGSYCDSLYKKYKDTGSVTKVAKDEYDHFVTDITPEFAKEFQTPIKPKEAK